MSESSPKTKSFRKTLVPPSRSTDEHFHAHFDITAMVDLVFMMNIFFLVTWIGAAMVEIDLPAARHASATTPESSIIVTVKAGTGAGEPQVILDDGQEITLRETDHRLKAAVEEGMRKGKDTLLIKAERNVLLRDVVLVGASLQAVEGMKLRLAVMEKNK